MQWLYSAKRSITDRVFVHSLAKLENNVETILYITRETMSDDANAKPR